MIFDETLAYDYIFLYKQHLRTCCRIFSGFFSSNPKLGVHMWAEAVRDVAKGRASVLYYTDNILLWPEAYLSNIMWWPLKRPVFLLFIAFRLKQGSS